MRCSEFRERLEAFVDGELALDAAEAVRKHIADCRACRILYEDRLGFRRSVKEVLDLRAPAELRQAIMQAAAEDKAADLAPAAEAKIRRLPLPASWVLPAAAALLLAIMALWWGLRQAGTPETGRLAHASRVIVLRYGDGGRLAGEIETGGLVLSGRTRPPSGNKG